MESFLVSSSSTLDADPVKTVASAKKRFVSSFRTVANTTHEKQHFDSPSGISESVMIFQLSKQSEPSYLNGTVPS
jgi:hypothetical protein